MLTAVQCTNSFLVWKKKLPTQIGKTKIDEFVLYAKQNNKIFKFVHDFYEISMRNDLWESGTQDAES